MHSKEIMLKMNYLLQTKNIRGQALKAKALKLANVLAFACAAAEAIYNALKLSRMLNDFKQKPSGIDV